MEYTAFIFDIVIGFIYGLIGLLYLFDPKKDFVSNTGLIGLICGVVGFVLTFVYVVFNGLVYTTLYAMNDNGTKGIIKRDGDYAIAEKDETNFKGLYFDHEKNDFKIKKKISDLGKKLYNYDKDGLESYGKVRTATTVCIDDNNNITQLCANHETLTGEQISGAVTAIANPSQCDMIYINPEEILGSGLDEYQVYKTKTSDRFLAALILFFYV